MNKYPYTLDNKRYTTLNYYFKTNFNSKVSKIPINANFTCPNRDGTKGTGGCTFCSELGSGEFQGGSRKDYLTQYEEGKEVMFKKWPNSKTIPYFQSFSNTYGSLERIKDCVEPFLNKDEVVGIAIATRADCLSDEVISYLDACSKSKEIWIELGLQSIYDETANRINRCHTYHEFEESVYKLRDTGIKVCVHIMNGLENETEEMMINTARTIGKLPIDAVKIHMLHIIKSSKMGKDYLNNPFNLLNLEEYVKIVVTQLRHLPKEIVIQRVTGDGMLDELIAPLWTVKKTIVINEIDKYMAKYDYYQGDLYE